MEKICEGCKELKDDTHFKTENSTVCNECKKVRAEARKQRYASIDLGIENLDNLLETIIVLKNNAQSSFRVPFRKAYSLVETGEATVYAPDTIYLQKKRTGYMDIREYYDRILKEQNYICHYCGEHGDTIDHIIPKSSGGSNERTNLICACSDCNYLKGTMSYEDFTFLIKKHGIAKTKLKLRNRIKNKNKSASTESNWIDKDKFNKQFTEIISEPQKDSAKPNLNDMIKRALNKP